MIKLTQRACNLAMTQLTRRHRLMQNVVWDILKPPRVGPETLVQRHHQS